MKRFFLLLSIVFGMVYTGLAQPPASSYNSGGPAPGTSYPAAALKGKMTGSGTCEVLFDAGGLATSVRIIKSTGSKILDDNTVRYGYQH